MEGKFLCPIGKRSSIDVTQETIHFAETLMFDILTFLAIKYHDEKCS